MIDSELLALDAEYWFILSNHHVAHTNELNPYLMRIAYIETEYGLNLDADGEWINTPAFTLDKYDTRIWFSLLLSEVVAHNEAG